MVSRDCVMVTVTLGLIVMNALAKLLGFARDQGLAITFGPGVNTDAYMVAITIPNLFFGSVAMAMGAAFIPVFTEYFAGGHKQEAWDLASTLLNAFLLSSVVLSAFGMLLAPFLVRTIAPGFDLPTAELASRLLMLVFPTIIAIGLYGILMALMHSLRQFIAPALGPVVLNLTVLLSIYRLAPHWGIETVAVATLIGAGLQALVVVVVLPRTGFSYRWTINWHHPGLARVLALSLPIVLASLMTQGYVLIDRNLASGLEPGTISALTFANKVVQLPQGLFVMAVATVLYPAFSEYASRGDYVALGKSVQSGLRKVAFITFPAATGLIILRTPIIRLLFERGEFDARATYITAAALLWYALGMFFHGSNQVLIRSFHSMQDTVRPLQIISITVLVNVVCAITLVRPLGHVGLAMANSIGALSGFLLFITVLKTRIHLGSWQSILRTVGRVAASTMMMGVTAHLTYQCTHALAGGKWGGLFEVGSAIAVGGLVYGFALWLMGVEEMRSLLSFARRQLGVNGRLGTRTSGHER